MNRGDILERLKAHREKLRDFRIQSLALFGSVARGEARPDSDVDFLVEFEGPATFDQYMGLKCFLEDVLGRPVDLVTRNGIRPQLVPYVEREAVHVA